MITPIFALGPPEVMILLRRLARMKASVASSLLSWKPRLLRQHGIGRPDVQPAQRHQKIGGSHHCHAA